LLVLEFETDRTWRPTWNGVIQDDGDHPADEDSRLEQNGEDLIEYLDTCQKCEYKKSISNARAYVVVGWALTAQYGRVHRRSLQKSAKTQNVCELES
jgi:hypothetical protein